MNDDRIKRISPLVDQLFPEASEQEKEVLTTELRPFFRLLLETYSDLDARGLLEPDSSEIQKLGRI